MAFTNSRYLAVIIPPREIYQRYKILQNRFRVSAWQERIGPHITLYRPFTSIHPESVLIQALRKSTQLNRCFLIDIDGLGRFNNEYVVLYAAIYLSEQLLKLQRDIAQALHDYVAPASQQYASYIPHLTLSSHLTTAEANLQEISLSYFPLSDQFPCEAVTLLRVDQETNAWKQIAQLPLRS